MMPLEGPAMYRRDTYHPVCARHDPVGGVPERALFVVIPEGAGPVKSWLCCCVGRCLAVVRCGLGAPREASVSRVGREADRVAAEGPGRWRRAVHAVWADRR